MYLEFSSGKMSKFSPWKKAPRNHMVPSECFGIYGTVCIEGQNCIKGFQYGSLILAKPWEETIHLYVCAFDLTIFKEYDNIKEGGRAKPALWWQRTVTARWAHSLKIQLPTWMTDRAAGGAWNEEEEEGGNTPCWCQPQWPKPRIP